MRGYRTDAKDHTVRIVARRGSSHAEVGVSVQARQHEEGITTECGKRSQPSGESPGGTTTTGGLDTIDISLFGCMSD